MLIGRSAEASGIEVLIPLAAEIGWVALWVPLTDGWLATVLVVVASITKAGEANLTARLIGSPLFALPAR